VLAIINLLELAPLAVLTLGQAVMVAALGLQAQQELTGMSVMVLLVVLLEII
jgi:hypothetical protein